MKTNSITIKGLPADGGSLMITCVIGKALREAGFADVVIAGVDGAFHPGSNVVNNFASRLRNHIHPLQKLPILITEARET